MKKAWSLFRGALLHATLILSMMLLVFYVIDLFNPSMAFLNNSMTKLLLAVDAVFTVILSVALIVERENKK